MKTKNDIKKPEGKLGILTPGMGAVATTFMAGVIAANKGLGKPFGSYTQMGKIRLGKRTEHRNVDIKDFVPLAPLDSVVFGGWDIFTDSAYESAVNAKVLDKDLLDNIKDELSSIKPMKAVFNPDFVKNIDGENVKKEKTKMDEAKALMADIENFKKENGLDRAVMIWCASTEVYTEPNEVHLSIDKFEKALEENHPAIAPSMIYAYAAIKSGVPFGNGAPNLTVDIPALVELAKKEGVAILFRVKTLKPDKH